jgi:hypothetical protein
MRGVREFRRAITSRILRGVNREASAKMRLGEESTVMQMSAPLHFASFLLLKKMHPFAASFSYEYFKCIYLYRVNSTG